MQPSTFNMVMDDQDSTFNKQSINDLIEQIEYFDQEDDTDGWDD